MIEKEKIFERQALAREYCYDKYLLTKNKMYFTMQELQAINEKVKELGWNE